MEQDVTNLSKEKWQWLADGNIDKLAKLFNARSMFVHLLFLIPGLILSTSWLYAQTSMIPAGDLSSRQQSIVRMASLAAIGDLANLAPALNAGLDAGLTVNETREVLVHLYAYCGFPRSIRGLQTLMAVLEERKKRGITDPPGKTASPITSTLPKYERGKRILDSLSGRPQNGQLTGYSAFSPEIDTFLKEHLFADLFERDVLTYADRELTTISVLTAIGGVEPMLQGHLGICLNTGLTGMQLREAFGVMEKTIGKAKSDTGRMILEQVISARR